MFGIGFFELVIIGVVALLLVGPDKLPDLARKAGKFFVHMRRISNEVRSTIDNVVHEAEAEIRQKERDAMALLLNEAKTKHEAENPPQPLPVSTWDDSPEHAQHRQEDPPPLKAAVNDEDQAQLKKS